MFVPFDEMPAHSRIWVYQSDRPLSPDELQTLASSLEKFCTDWSAHGHPLKTSYCIEFSHFIILAADETAAGASGCSIDGSVRHLKSLGTQLGVDFFNRNLIPFLVDGTLSLIPIAGLRESFAGGRLNSETLTVNTLAATIGAFRTSWMIPAGQTWTARYLPSAKTA